MGRSAFSSRSAGLASKSACDRAGAASLRPVIANGVNGLCVPGGATNSIQYNAGSGTLSGVGPLTNGQLVVGSTGGVPQAATITAGPGISITNGPGSVTIGTTGAGSGLYSQIMSVTPTMTSTGFIINSGAGSLTNVATGLTGAATSSTGV